MWNLIACNNLTEERMRQKSYDKHVDKVNKMKSKLKLCEPEQPWFVYEKKKKELARNQQLFDIQKNNHLLLSKIKGIEIRQNQTFKRSNFITTLNSKIARQTQNGIFKQNRRICDKIMHTDSFYKTSSILERSNNLEQLTRSISLNARRVQSAKSLALSRSKISRPVSSSVKRPQSSYIRGNQGLEVVSRFSHSGLTRPSSAPSIKKLKLVQEKHQLAETESEQHHNEG